MKSLLLFSKQIFVSKFLFSILFGCHVFYLLLQHVEEGKIEDEDKERKKRG